MAKKAKAALRHSSRGAGILLAVSSLPSPYGIGSFGEAALRWIDFLKEAGQRYWQILPLGPTGWGDSPYQSFSAFALSPYYIDLDELRRAGLLRGEDLEGVSFGRRPGRVNYAALYRYREKVLRLAFERFRAGRKGGGAFDDFRAGQNSWLADYSLFMALKRRYGGKPWLEWETGFRFRNEKDLALAEKEYAEDVLFHSFIQYTACTQWRRVKEYANRAGVSVIGDMPIYVSLDSADTWANSDYFQLDGDRRPLRIAGCPPDPFAAGGQLWGNPLYRWDLMEKENFGWWIERLRFNFSLFDVVRIDHFRGFESYFSIPAGARDARGGEWVKGPGIAFINAVNSALPGVRIIAEDLGYLTDGVRSLLKASGYPGMKVLQFAFDSRESANYMPYTYERNSVVYTGTHDNATCQGWFKNADPEDVNLAKEYFGFTSIKEGHWAFIRGALSAVADLAVIPLQDYLGLGNEGRMNTPSTQGNNWQWRMKDGDATAELAAKIGKLTALYGRI
jgi:4-alpha-glucanotransferase